MKMNVTNMNHSLLNWLITFFFFNFPSNQILWSGVSHSAPCQSWTSLCTVYIIKGYANGIEYYWRDLVVRQRTLTLLKAAARSRQNHSTLLPLSTHITRREARMEVRTPHILAACFYLNKFKLLCEKWHVYVQTHDFTHLAIGVKVIGECETKGSKN